MATQQGSRTKDEDYQDLRIDHLHYWLKSQRPRAKNHGRRAKKRWPTTECEEEWQRAKKQWPIADKQRISKAEWRQAKKQQRWSKNNDEERRTMAKWLRAKTRRHRLKNDDKTRRNDDYERRQQQIDWRVNNLKIFPWERRNLFLSKEVRMATTADEEQRRETNQFVVWSVGIRDQSLQITIRTADCPKRTSLDNRSEYRERVE